MEETDDIGFDLDTFEGIYASSNMPKAPPTHEMSEEPEEIIEEESDQNPSLEEDDTAGKKKRLSQNERLKRQISELREQNSMLLHEKENERQRSYQLSNQNAQLTDMTVNEQYKNLEEQEKFWNLKREDLEYAYAGAYEAGDSQSLAKTASRMTESQLKLDQIQNQKNILSDQYNNYKKNAQTVQHQQQSYAPQVKDENLDNFLNKYEFLKPDANNRNYSPEAFSVVNRLSSELATQYKIDGRGSDISSPEYYSDLEGMMKKELFTNRTSSAPAMRSSRMVAPVGKRQNILHDQPAVAFNEHENKFITAFINEFGKEHADLVKKEFSQAKKTKITSNDDYF